MKLKFIVPLGAAVLLLIGPSASADNSRIGIEQVEDGVPSVICLPPALSLLQSVHNTSETFQLEVAVREDLCDPITATAVVYQMPGDGSSWPQTLVEQKSFQIKNKGTIKIAFSKGGCDPVQFDVITGYAPENIGLGIEMHGPLLFPVDTGTSLQYNPRCEPVTTTSTTIGTATSTTSLPLEVTTSTTTTTEVPAAPPAVLIPAADIKFTG